MITLRGQIFVSRIDDDHPCSFLSPPPPCVDSKRPRVCVQNVPVCTASLVVPRWNLAQVFRHAWVRTVMLLVLASLVAPRWTSREQFAVLPVTGATCWYRSLTGRARRRQQWHLHVCFAGDAAVRWVPFGREQMPSILVGLDQKDSVAVGCGRARRRYGSGMSIAGTMLSRCVPLKCRQARDAWHHGPF